MLYTGKGDGGTTKTLTSKDRISKSAALPECLGTMDELNSYLGLCKVKAEESRLQIGENKTYLCCLVHEVQENLFIIQSEIAGSDKFIEEWKVQRMEMFINEMETELPPIHSFTISGGTELSALFDITRTIARRAERKVVQVHEEEIQEISEFSLSYMNRLSSLLFAFARYVNQVHGASLEAPSYE